VEDVLVLFGAVIDPEMGEHLRVTLLAMRFDPEDVASAFVGKQPRIPRLRPGGHRDLPLPPTAGG
jgi:cell division GTPase FtsZ